MSINDTLRAFYAEHKTLALSVASGAGLAVLAGGIWIASASAAPGLPRDAKEAVSVMASQQFNRLDDARKAQYRDEAWRLFREMTPEERRALMQDEEARKAMAQMREDFFDDLVRRLARGEEMPRFPAGQRPEGQRPPREGMPQLSEEERAERMAQFRDRMAEQMQAQVESGNAQSGGLRQEMMKRGMRGAGRGGPAGGGGRRGG